MHRYCYLYFIVVIVGKLLENSRRPLATIEHQSLFPGEDSVRRKGITRMMGSAVVCKHSLSFLENP
jgi:hypothetical protein